MFSGINLINKIKKASKNGSTIFGVEVDNPERFGVIELNDKNKNWANKLDNKKR